MKRTPPMKCQPFLAKLLTPLFLVAFWPALVAAEEPGVRVPEGTEIFVSLGTALDNKTTRAEDSFYAVVMVPVTIDDRIAIPAQSRIKGWVDSIDKRKKDWVRLTFDRLILPSGRSFKMRGALGSREGKAPKEKSQKEQLEDDLDDLPSSLPGILTYGVTKGVPALIIFIEGKKRRLEKDTSVTVVLEADLLITPDTDADR